MKKLLLSLFMCVASGQALASWHYLQKVTKVSVLGNSIVIQGSSPSGHSCADYNGFYGTLFHTEGDGGGHKEYYSMALTAYTTGRGMACHVGTTGLGGQAVCKMENCHMIN